MAVICDAEVPHCAAESPKSMLAVPMERAEFSKPFFGWTPSRRLQARRLQAND